MVDHPALFRAFSDYARTLSGRYDIGDVLYRLTDHVTAVVDVDGAGVSLEDKSGGLRFVTATDDLIVRVEARQVEAQQGPCQDAWTSGERITCADLEAETRWPAYSPVALENGCRAVAGIPMTAGGQRVGALNLYSRKPRAWPEDDIEVAQMLADMASGYILNARSMTEAERVSTQLQHALDSRVVIEQAKGILAERHGEEPAAAFERLRRHARGRNTKIHDVARGVVDGALRL